MNHIPYRLVAVEWVDSYGCGSVWSELPDTAPAHHCYSVGWLVRQSDDVVVIVPHLSPPHADIGAEEQGCGDMTIPRVAIVEMRDLQ